MMKRERQRSTFSVEELTHILDGGKDVTKMRHHVENLFKNDKQVQVPYMGNMTREERFVNAVKRSVYFYKHFLNRNGWDYKSSGYSFADRGGIAEYVFGLHFGAFIPCIHSFGSKEQVKKWAPIAEDLGIIGAYAQTELAHGSNLRELQTTVTYDMETQEFVVNSPSITAAKWWPGDMGLLANHVLLMSNLFVNGKNLGMHPFIVQIRDLSTHKPLPGVQVGDIGDKMAFETIDNGYLLFDNIRIPRENLLCKNAELKADGTYVKHTSDRMMYASMSRLRVILIKGIIIARFSKACTIATRYSAVRRQGKINSSGGEVAVLDYMAQQHKIIPQLAAVYALNFANRDLNTFYEQTVTELEVGNLTNLPEMHVLSASMKACASEQAVLGCETLRRACGGHGYANSSGLPRLYSSVLPSCTYEGENTVMYLQVARFLLKCATQIGTNTLKGSVAYLDQDDDIALKRGNCKDLDSLVRAFQRRSRESLRRVALKFQDLMAKGTMSMSEAGNFLSIELIATAKAYVMQYIVGSFAHYCVNGDCSNSLRPVLMSLCLVYALHHINDNQGEFIKLGALKQCCCDHLIDAEKDILTELRPNAIALVDAFDYQDEALQSCIGCYDGEVYQRLFENAKSAPMNKNDVHEASYQHIRPYLLKGRDMLEGNQKSKL